MSPQSGYSPYTGEARSQPRDQTRGEQEEERRLRSLTPATQYSTPNVATAGRTGRRVKLAQRFLPTDDPHMASLYYHLATDPRYQDDRSYMDAVASAGGFVKARQYVRFFKDLHRSTPGGDWDKAYNIWDDLSKRQQGYLQAMGVRDPNIHRQNLAEGSSGLIGDVLGAAWDVVGVPVAAGAKLAGKAIAPTLNAFSLGNRTVNTGYRMMSMTLGKTAEGQTFTDAAADMVDPEQIWNRAKYALDVAGEGGGERAVHMVDRDDALEILGGNQHLLDRALDTMVSGDPAHTALQMAQSRAKARGYTRESDPEAFQKTYQEAIEMVQSPKFLRAVTQLQAGKVSPGRDFVRSVLQPGDGEFTVPVIGKMNAHQIASGLVDATWTVTTDPVLIGGQFVKGYRLASRAMSVREIPTMIRAGEGTADEFTDALKTLDDEGFDDIVRAADDAKGFGKQRYDRMDELKMTPQEKWAADHIHGLRGAEADRLAALAKMHNYESRFVQTTIDANRRAMNFYETVPTKVDNIVEHDEALSAAVHADASPEAIADARIAINQGQQAEQLAQVGGDGIATPTKFREFLESAEGLSAVLGGKASNGMSPAIMWPKISRTSQRWMALKMSFEDRLGEWEKLGGWKAYHLETPFELPPEALGKPGALNQIKAMAAGFVKGVTQQLPTENLTKAMGPEAGENLQKWLRFSMTPDEVWKGMGEFYAQTNAAGRRIVVHNLVQSAMDRMGLRGTEFYEMWTSGLDTLADRSMAYSVNPRTGTLTLQDGSKIPAALFKSQLADNVMALPSPREMIKALPKLGAYRDITTGRMLMRGLDSKMIDAAVNRWWKPMVLLRLGFIPRAAGEESLAWFAREPGELAKAWFAYPFQYPDRLAGQAADVAAPLRWIARAERRFRHFDFADEYNEIYGIKQSIMETGEASEQQGKFLYDHIMARRIDEQGRVWEPMAGRGQAYKTTSAKHRPLFHFDPADVRGTLKLQNYLKQATRGLVDDADLAALRMIAENDAIIRTHMQYIVGGDHYLWPTYAEMKNTRGALELGGPTLAGQRSVRLTVDRSRWRHYAHAKDDPLAMASMDTLNLQGSLDEGIAVPVRHAITGYVPPHIRGQIDTVLTGQTGTGALNETVSAMDRIPTDLHADLERLQSHTAGQRVGGDDLSAEIKGSIHKQIAKMGDDPDAGIMSRLMERWDSLTSEQQAVLIQRRGVLYAGLDPVNPEHATRIDLLNRTFDNVDAEDARTAQRQLLYDTIRQDLLSPTANLDEFDRSMLVGGRLVAAAPLEGQHRIWFPMMSERHADDIARRIAATGNAEDKALLTGYYTRVKTQPPGDGTNFVPFGHWAHDDPRQAAAVATRLGRGEVPVTVGYIDLPKAWMPSYRRAADPQGEWRWIDSALFNRDAMTVAPSIDDVVRVRERQIAAGSQIAEREYGLREQAAQMQQELGAEGVPVRVEVLPDRPGAAAAAGAPDPQQLADDFAAWRYYDEQLNYVTPENEMLFEPEIGQAEARRGRSDAADRLADHGYDMDYDYDVERLTERFGTEARPFPEGVAERPTPVRPVFEGEEAARPPQPRHRGPREVKGGYSSQGRGSRVGDGKDQAMRQDADSAIVELANDKPSSSRTTIETLGSPGDESRVVMLARNGELKNTGLKASTVDAIAQAHARGARFVVGDMPGVDDVFISVLDDLGADYVVYHAGARPRVHLVEPGAGLSFAGGGMPSREILRQQAEASPGYQEIVGAAREARPAAEVVEHQGVPVATATVPDETFQHGVGPTWDDMIDEFANKRADEIMHRYMEGSLETEGGVRVPRYGIARPVGEGRWNTRYLYTDGVSLPTETIGPSMTFHDRNIWDDFQRWGFDRIIGPAIDTIVRRPMYISAMAKSIRQAEEVAGHLFHAPLVQKVQRVVSDEAGTEAVEVSVSIRELAKRYGFEDHDELFRVLKPTLAWARDSGLPVNSVEDLQKVIGLRAADLNTEGIQDITHNVRRLLNDIRAERGATTLTDHPISKIIEPATEPRRVIVNKRPKDTTRAFFREGDAGGWRTTHPEVPDGYSYVDFPTKDLEKYRVAPDSPQVNLPESITAHAEEGTVRPVSHLTEGERFEHLPPDATPEQAAIVGRENLARARERGRVRQVKEITDEEVQALNKWFLSEDDARNQLAKIAGTRAFNESMRYIDDHTIRSQFADTVRNLVPFYFAEEQFLKRWARTIVYDPAGIRKIQLLKHGLDSTGLVKKDPQTGQDYFVYPFSAELNEGLGKVSDFVLGGHHRLPIYVPMTGQVQYALPGLDNKGLPQVGPTIAIPLKALANRFPELRDAEYKILGSRAAGLPLVTQVVPASIGRFWQAFTASPDRSREMASAMTAVIQMMEANGQAPKDDASPKDVEQYLDRVESWTRTMMVTRAILGFAGPAAPSPSVPGKELSVEFRRLMKDLPIGEAAAAFIQMNPDATPFTVFGSKSISGAALPTGKRALDWMKRNEDMVREYPMGAPWLIPQEYADDKYEAQSYNQQIALGIRERRLPDEMYEEIKFAKASPMYFDTRDEYQKRIALARGGGNSAQANALEEEYGRWRTSYLAQHPLFADQLASPTARQRRLDVLDQLTQMVDDRRVPRTAVTPTIRYVIDAYNEYDAMYNALRYDRSSRATKQRQNLRTSMFNHLEAYTREHREARALYLRVIRPELDVTGASF